MKHTTYQLERIPDHLWREVKSRAAIEGKSMREVLLRLLTVYAGLADTTEEQTGTKEN